MKQPRRQKAAATAKAAAAEKAAARVMSEFAKHHAAADKAFPTPTLAEQQLADREYQAQFDTFQFDQGRLAKVKAKQSLRSAAKPPKLPEVQESEDVESARVIKTRAGYYEFEGEGPTTGMVTQYVSCCSSSDCDNKFRTGTKVAILVQCVQ